MKIELRGKAKYVFSKKDLLGNRKNSKFSNVYKATDLDNNKYVVIKELKPSQLYNIEAKRNFRYEGELEFNHKNIQKKIEFIEINNQLYIVYEYVEGIDLLEFSKKNKKLLTNDNTVFKNIFIKLLEALKYLHEKKYIHADIKPHNIIINNTQQNYLDLKIIDFGQTQNYGSNKNNRKVPFSLVYSPPEQFLKAYSIYNQTIDFYSLGITMYQVLTGKLPFKTVSNPLMLMALQLNMKIEKHKRINNQIFNIIEKATSKYIFPRPYFYFSKKEVIEMLKKGQSKRYQSCDEFIADIKKLS